MGQIPKSPDSCSTDLFFALCEVALGLGKRLDGAGVVEKESRVGVWVDAGPRVALGGQGGDVGARRGVLRLARLVVDGAVRAADRRQEDGDGQEAADDKDVEHKGHHWEEQGRHHVGHSLRSLLDQPVL